MSSLFNELKRRNVFKVAAAYGVVGWLIIQVVTSIAEPLSLPDWVPTLFVVLVLAGLPIAVLFAWAFELTPDGVKMAKDVPVNESITANTGQKINYIIIGALILLVGGMAIERTMFASGGGDTVAEQPSIAVLAFENISNDPDQDYFADGISEEILNLLAKTEAMKVAGRTSSFSFKGKDSDIPTIAEQLNVNHVLEGSIRKSGNTLRITAQLIRDDGYHMWSETYDRELTDIFAIQDEISAAIMDELSVRLLGEAPKAATDNTNSITALDHFLKGRNLLHDDSSFEGIAQARAEIERALELDPDFVKAELMLYHAQLRQLDTGSIRANPTMDELEAKVQAYTEAHPMDVEGWVLIARLTRIKEYLMRGSGAGFHPEKALPFIEKAKALGANTSEFYTLYGQILYGIGQKVDNKAQMEAGIRNARLGLQLEPLSALAHRNLADLLSAYDKDEEAIEIINRGLEISPNDPELLAQMSSTARGLNYDIITVLEYSIRASNASPNDAELMDDVVRHYLSIGDYTRANKWADKGLALSPNYMSTIGWKTVGELLQGQNTKAFARIDATLQNPDTIYRKWRIGGGRRVHARAMFKAKSAEEMLAHLYANFPELESYQHEPGADIPSFVTHPADPRGYYYATLYRMENWDRLSQFRVLEDAIYAQRQSDENVSNFQLFDSEFMVAFVQRDFDKAAEVLNRFSARDERARANGFFTRMDPTSSIVVEYMEKNNIPFIVDTWAAEKRKALEALEIDP